MVQTRRQKSSNASSPRCPQTCLATMITEHPFILILLCEYLSLQEIVLSFSSVSKTLFSLLISNSSDSRMVIWRLLLLRYFPKYSVTSSPSPSDSYQEFQSLASIRIWNWDSLFHSRVFWAQVGFTMGQFFEDFLIFGASVSSSTKNIELRKLNGSNFDDWNDGHNLLFSFPEGYRLWYQISDHTMGTWTLEMMDPSAEISTICRLDGHPLLPGFTYLQAEILITYLKNHPSLLLFNSLFLWPLFFPFIELSTATLPYCDQLIENLQSSGWRSLRLAQRKWKDLEGYIRRRCETEPDPPSEQEPLLALCQLLQTQQQS
jgi:hypothetical protein